MSTKSVTNCDECAAEKHAPTNDELNPPWYLAKADPNNGTLIIQRNDSGTIHSRIQGIDVCCQGCMKSVVERWLRTGSLEKEETARAMTRPPNTSDISALGDWKSSSRATAGDLQL